MSSKVRQPDMTKIEGCLIGLDHFLTAFGIEEDQIERKEEIYEKLLRVCPKPEQDGGRRVAMRTGLSVMANHCSLFGNFLVHDRKDWYRIMTDWAFSQNREDHKMGWKAIVNFLQVVGEQLQTKPNEKAFHFFIEKFKSHLNNPKSSAKESTIGIKGYGNLAGACKKILSPQDTSTMMFELTQKTEEVFFSTTASLEGGEVDKVTFLPSYVEALSDVIVQVEEVSPSSVAVYERIVVYLISNYPKLPPQYHFYGVNAIAKALVSCSERSSLSSFVSNTFYHALIESCSYPVVTKEEDEIFQTDKKISVKSYFSFWKNIIQHNFGEDKSFNCGIFDAFMNSAIKILKKLDLSVKESEKVEDENEDDALEANHVKDFTVLSNLVELISYVCDISAVEFFRKWVQTLGYKVIELSCMFPEVSDLHRLFVVILKMSKRCKILSNLPNGNSESDIIFVFSSYLSDVLTKCLSYDPELLQSCLHLCVSIPSELAEGLIDPLGKPLEYIFYSGTSNLELVDKAIQTLAEWNTSFKHREALESLVESLLPSLKNFLQECKVETYDSGEVKVGLLKKKKEKGVISLKRADSSLTEQIQSKLLLLLGSFPLGILRRLCPTKEELGKTLRSWSMESCLSFSIPFPDCRPEIWLDELLPRVIHLCLHSSNRKTKVAAAECFHVFVVFLIGKSASQTTVHAKQKPLTHLYEQAFPVLLKLSTDSDLVINNLFHPLALQCTHWFTRATAPPAETILLLDQILEGLCSESDIALRKKCGRFLAEFLKWSIKQTPPDKMAECAHNPQSIFERLYAMWLHPKATRRLGACLAFNYIYRVFREEEPLVKMFTLEIVVHVVKSISLSKSDGGETTSLTQESKKNIDHLVRIIKEKIVWFNRDDDIRRTPTDFDGNSLKDLTTWLFHVISDQEEEARHKAQELIFTFTNAESRKSLVKERLKKIGVDFSTFVRRILKTDLDEANMKMGKVMDESVIFMEVLNFFVREKLHNKEILEKDHAVMMDVSKIIETVLSSDLTESNPKTRHLLQKKRCTLLVRVFQFVIVLLDQNVELAASLWSMNFWNLVLKCYFAPHSIGFNVNDLVQKEGLSQILKKLMETFKTKLGKSVNIPMPNFKKPFPDTELEPTIDRCLQHNVDDSLLQKIVAFKKLVDLKLITDGPNDLLEKLFDPKNYEPSPSSPLKLEAYKAVIDISIILAAKLSHIFVLIRLYSKNKSNPVLDEAIVGYVMKKPDGLVKKLLSEQIDKRYATFSFLIRIFKLVIQSGTKYSDSEKKNLAIGLLEHWTGIVEFAATSSESFLTCVLLLKHVAFAAPNELFEKDEVVNWFRTQMERSDLSLSTKNKLLDLLPAFLKSRWALENELALDKTLNMFASNSFPLDSSTLDTTSLDYREYIDSMASLVRALSATFSSNLLQLLMSLICREKNHIYTDKLQEDLDLTRLASTAVDQLNLLNASYDMFADDARCSQDMRLRVLDLFLFPILSGCNVVAMTKFYVGKITDILEPLLQPVTGSEDARVKVLVSRIGSCKLIEILYGKLDKDYVHSASSEIVQKAFPFLKSKDLVKSGAAFSGKELSVFLVGKLSGFRAEVIDGSPNLLTKLRQFHCSSYNATMSVISCLQTAEKFFNNYIFKENVSKSEMIWTRIIDVNMNYEFPLEGAEFSQRRTKITSIRRANKSGDANHGQFLPSMTQSHFLSEGSSLTQDLPSYDFNDSNVRMPSEIVKPDPDTAQHQTNIIALQQDELNDHECMAQLVAVIELMNKNAIYAVPEEGVDPAKLPDWMQSIKSKLTEDSVPNNVKLFLLKLVINCSETFKPFAKLLLPDILSLVVTQHLWSDKSVMNNLRMDLITILLSWSDVCIPKGDMMQRTNASALLEEIFRACLDEQNREILRYLVELSKTLIQLWRECVNIRGRSMFELVQKISSDRNTLKSSITLKIIANLLEAKLEPVTNSSGINVRSFWGMIVQLMGNDFKQLHSLSSAVIGMALQVYKNSDKGVFEALEEAASSKLREISRSSSMKDSVKFIECLYQCHKGYPEIAAKFSSNFMYGLQNQPSECLTHCLKMLSAVAPAILESGNELETELNMINIEKYLQGFGAENLMAGLSFLKLLVFRMSPELALKYLGHFLYLTSHPKIEVRTLVFSIFKDLFVNFAPPLVSPEQEEVFNKTVTGLTKAFSDDYQAIQDSVMEFFSSSDILTDSTLKRLPKIFEIIYNEETQSDFLQVCSNLLLILTEKSPELDRKLYSDPLNAQCEFRNHFINTSWRSQNQSDLTPRFVETLSSQSGAGGGGQNYVRATQVSLAFAPTQGTFGTVQIFTQQTELMSQSRSTHGAQKRSYKQSDNSFGQQDMSMDTQDSSQKSNSSISLMVGKRFSKSTQFEFERSKTHFARVHNKRQERRRQLLEDRKERRHAHVSLMRKYRIGELPDIQISNADVVKSLKNLCTRDDQMARSLCILLSKSLSETHEDFKEEMKNTLGGVIQEGKMNNRTLTATVFELSQIFQSSFSSSRLIASARALQLEPVAILLLESKLSSSSSDEVGGASQSAKRRKTKGSEDVDHDPSSMWLQLLELYKSIQDEETVRGLKMEFSPAHSALSKAVSDESCLRWESAAEKYKRGMEKSQDKERRILEESYLLSLEKLSEWKEIYTHIEDGDDVDDMFDEGWKQQVLLPHFFRSGLHTLIEHPDVRNGLFTVIDKATKRQKGDYEYLKRNFGLELVLLFIYKSKLNDAQMCLESSQHNFIKDWSSLTHLSKSQSGDHIMKLKRLSQVGLFMESLKKPTEFMEEKASVGERDFMDLVSLQDGDDILRDHALFYRNVLESSPGLGDAADLNKSNGCMRLCRESLRRNDFPLAYRMLKKARNLMTTGQEPEESIFQQLFTEVSILKSLSVKSESFNRRFNALYRSLLSIEERMAGDREGREVLNKVMLIDATIEMIDELGNPRGDVQIIKDILDKRDKVQHFESLAGDARTLSSLKKSMHLNMVELMQSVDNLSGDDHMKLALYCYKLCEDDDEENDPEVVKLCIASHIRAINSGSIAARDEFPNIFQILQNAPATINNLFKREILTVEVWKILPWINQLVSQLTTDLCPYVLPIVKKIAQEYPHALQFPYNMSKENLSKNVCKELEPFLKFDSVTSRIVQGLSQVCVPVIKVSDFVTDNLEMVSSSAKKVDPKVLAQEVSKNYSELRSEFQREDVGVAYKRFLRSSLADPGKINEPSQFLKKMREKLKNYQLEKLNLEALAPFLANYHISSYDGSMEIPGQYYGYQKPDPASHVKLSAFLNQIRIFGSLRKPIKLTMLGDNGKKFDFIVKFGEDLRQDERIQQLFAIVNTGFQRQGNSELRIKCYKVVPISNKLGLIECLGDTTAYKELAMSPKNSKPPAGVMSADEFKKQIVRSHSSRLTTFQKATDNHDLHVMHRSFLRLTTSPEGYFFFRDNFLRSHALHCVVGWIMSIGDRHADNLLVSYNTGESIPIDFGYSFGATAFLPIPELSPFRYTPQMRTLAKPLLKYGPVREVSVFLFCF